jgi:hypothetical protein
VHATGQHPLSYPLLSGVTVGQATADELAVETIARASIHELQRRALALAAVSAGRHPGDLSRDLTGELIDATPGGKR